MNDLDAERHETLLEKSDRLTAIAKRCESLVDSAADNPELFPIVCAALSLSLDQFATAERILDALAAAIRSHQNRMTAQERAEQTELYRRRFYGMESLR